MTVTVPVVVAVAVVVRRSAGAGKLTRACGGPSAVVLRAYLQSFYMLNNKQSCKYLPT